MTGKIATVLGFAALASAHAVMDTPKPCNYKKGLTSGPMIQSEFPCKKNEAPFADNCTCSMWSGGSPQLLHLATAATHGGGVCFIAMTYASPNSQDFDDPSNWRNVYTIPGDCPATTALNLDTVNNNSDDYPSGVQCSSSNSNQTDCVHSYTIPMPDELMDGPVTFAWVWLSHLTDETYMNCAPITITEAKNNGGFDLLPDLKGLSFTGLSGGGPPKSPAINDGNSNPPIQTMTTPTTLKTTYFNNITATAVSEVSNVVNISHPAVCREGAIPCSSSGFFCVNKTTFGKCALGCAVPMQMSAGTLCLDNAVTFAHPRSIRLRTE